jgi:putative ABC transport system ATP-binding protein
MGNRLPNLIWGGELEGVGVARAIVNHPSILLADEPTGNLDTRTTRGIMELLKRLNSEGMTILMVTHNPECAQYARRVLHLSDGLVVEKEEAADKEGGNGSGLDEWKGEATAADRSRYNVFFERFFRGAS